MNINDPRTINIQIIPSGQPKQADEPIQIKNAKDDISLPSIILLY